MVSHRRISISIGVKAGREAKAGRERREDGAAGTGVFAFPAGSGCFHFFTILSAFFVSLRVDRRGDD